MTNNLAYIDAEKCKMCRKCEEACPKGAIHAVNFPPRKPKPAVPATPVASKTSESIVKSSEEPKVVAKAVENPKKVATNAKQGATNEEKKSRN